MCKEGWCVRLGWGWEGGYCLKYLKNGWNRKEGRRLKDFEKRDKLGQGVGASKRETAHPLRTMP